MKIHRVERKWFRKNGTLVVRNYTYTKNSKYSDVNHKLTIKRDGKFEKTKFYDKLVERLRDEYKSDAEAYINLLDSKINSASHNGKEYSQATFMSQLKDTQREKYFFNMGGDIDEIADELGVSREDLIDENGEHWKGDTFIFDGFAYTFKFDYDNGGISWIRKPL